MSEKEFVKELNILIAKVGGKTEWQPDYGAPVWCGTVELEGEQYNLQFQEEIK